MMRFEDPSIDAAARAIASAAWDEIEGYVRAGVAFYVARERVCARLGPAWTKTYGADCAGRALRMIHAIDPHDPANWTAATLVARPADPVDWTAAVVGLLCFAICPTTWIAAALLWFGVAGSFAGALLLFSGLAGAYGAWIASRPRITTI